MEDNTPTLEEIRSAFGLVEDTDGAEDSDNNTETPDGADTPDGSDENNTDTPDENEGSDGNEDTEGKGEAPEEKSTQKHKDSTQKQNQAFAKLRTDNAQMQKTLSAMASILGIDPKLPAEQLNEQLQAQARNALAKKNGMPPEFLQRLEYLEDINNRYQQSQLELKANNAFAQIKEKFGATDDDLKAFVAELTEDNFDLNTGDLVTEFISRNFDNIVNAKVEAAIQAEQKRHSEAGDASKPNGKQGQKKEESSMEINSVADLNKLLDNL